MFSPAAERNKRSIQDVLSPALPASGVLLELACGALQHACYIAPYHPNIIWQPTDINPQALAHGAGIDRPGNVLQPVHLDVLAQPWPVAQADIIYSANLLHISPSEVPAALFRGAQRLQVSEVFIYGPFIVDGDPTTESNLRFDESLRARNSDWGIRQLNDVQTTGAYFRYQLAKVTPMPAHNLLLQFTRIAQVAH